MIADNWKKDIANIARKLEGRFRQKTWNVRSGYAVEKSLALGLLAVRKLIEAKEVSHQVLGNNPVVYEFKLPQNRKSLLGKLPIERLYDFRNGKKTSLSIETVCHQFIHSVIFRPYVPTRKVMLGVFVSSDKQRTKSLFYIPLEQIIGLMRSVAKDSPVSPTMIVNKKTGKRSVSFRTKNAI